jgi:hypothetical protein
MHRRGVGGHTRTGPGCRIRGRSDSERGGAAWEAGAGTKGPGAAVTTWVEHGTPEVDSQRLAAANRADTEGAITEVAAVTVEAVMVVAAVTTEGAAATAAAVIAELSSRRARVVYQPHQNADPPQSTPTKSESHTKSPPQSKLELDVDGEPSAPTRRGARRRWTYIEIGCPHPR